MKESPLHSLAPVLRVADLTRSLAFYGRQLGFEPEFIFKDFYAGVIRDGCRIHLKCVQNSRLATARSFDPEHIDVCIGVADAAAESTRLAAADVPFVVSLRRMEYGTEFYVRDPDGHVLAFVQ